MAIPQEINWIPVGEFRSESYSCRHVLILTHKHSMSDWEIIMGWIQPIANYKDFIIMGKPNGIGCDYPDVKIKKSEIIALGLFSCYGSILD